jgi:uncharacterized protein YukE
MATPSIKSLIVNALVGKIDMMRVKREFLLDKFIKIHKPLNLHGIPRNYSAYDEFVQSLYRLGVTPDEFEQWNQEWEELVHACEKRAKKRALNEISIETILKAKLKGTGIRYQMRKQQYRVALTLTMGHYTQATFYIQHSKFREQLDMVLPAVNQLNQLMDELGQPIRVRNRDYHIDWTETE